MKTILMLMIAFTSFTLLATEQVPQPQEDIEYYEYVRCETLIDMIPSIEFIFQPERSENFRESIKKRIPMSDDVSIMLSSGLEGEIRGEVKGYMKLASEIFSKEQHKATWVKLYEENQCQRFHKPVPN